MTEHCTHVINMCFGVNNMTTAKSVRIRLYYNDYVQVFGLLY